MGSGGISERFGQIVTKYVVNTRIDDSVETLTPARLAHKLGLSTDSVSEVRRVMAGKAGKPNTDTLGRYFKALDVSETDQDYVLGIGLPKTMSFSDLVDAMQAHNDFGAPLQNESSEIREKKIRAKLARIDGDLNTADNLSEEIEKFQAQVHFYDKKDLEQSAENLAKTFAFRGSLALQSLDFVSAHKHYSKILDITGLPTEILVKFTNAIRICYNRHIFVQKNIRDARDVFAEMETKGISPNVVSYNTLLTFLKSEQEVRDAFAEMETKGIPPDVYSFTILVGKCKDIEDGKGVAAEFKKCFPNTASREFSSAFISIAGTFEEALSAATYLRSKKHFVGRKEFDKIFSYPVTHYRAEELLEKYFSQDFRFDTSLESPMNQYRKAQLPEQALQLLIPAPYVGAAQKFYREDYELCKSYFETELELGNDEDNLHYGYGIAAALNQDWQPARQHLTVALKRCFENAHKRREHINSLLAQVPP